jgi:hypothetical protein
MSTKQGLTQANQGPEGLSQDPADLDQDTSTETAVEAQGMPSANGTGTIKVTG